METTDNTLNEMQQQMQLLKDKLSKQTIVNEQMMRNAFGKGIKDLRSNYSVKTIAAIAGMLGCPSFYNLGCSCSAQALSDSSCNHKRTGLLILYNLT